MSSNSCALEIPTDNDPASTAHGPVLAQGITHTVFLGAIVHSYFLTILDYPVAVGRQSGGDEAGSSTGKVMLL